MSIKWSSRTLVLVKHAWYTQSKNQENELSFFKGISIRVCVILFFFVGVIAKVNFP